MHPKDVNSNPSGERSDNPQPEKTPAAADQRRLNDPQPSERAEPNEAQVPPGGKDSAGR
jgi:hypothetical protein